jgi:DNA ligase 1
MLFMKAFSQLYTRLDQTNKTNEKVSLLKDYFTQAADQDKLWALALFSHRRPRKLLTSTLLRLWASEQSDIPLWLLEESYHTVGDLAETISLLLPPPGRVVDQSIAECIALLQQLGSMTESERKSRILEVWDSMNASERLVFIKLMTGNFRIGISQTLVIRALSEVTGIPVGTLTHRVMGNWEPGKTTYQQLILSESDRDTISQPYPFCLAHPIEATLPADYAYDEALALQMALGEPQDWQAEWKWDGIRSQIIYRSGTLSVWSRGEELITEKFPEFHPLAASLPDGTVIDGEILPFQNDRPLSFAVLQTRIGRKNISAKNLKEAPVVLIAYDLLEWAGNDLREKPLKERRALLEELVGDLNPNIVRLSERVPFTGWEELIRERQQSREKVAEGLMLKRLDSLYHVGRKRGDWWKWKIEPYTIDGVLVYAQKGTGRRADLFTDYTFAAWDGDKLVPFTKAYSGLTDPEIREVDRFVRRNTQDKFGPVRTVKPELVFEIAFEGIQASNRHKSGVALRFPRILRWRKDKKMEDANQLSDLKALVTKVLKD